MTTILFFGFLLGLRHALEADHVAAVATLARGSPDLRRSLVLGASWGLGHSLTLLLVGTVVLWAGVGVPAEVARWLEALVGLLLVVLGLDVLRRLLRERIHFHLHRHGEAAHFHAHSHAGETDHLRSSHDHGHGHATALSGPALLVGVLHGLAGSAVLVLLTAEATHGLLDRLTYIAIFGLGSILGMAVLSVVISLPLRFAARQMTWAYGGLTLVLGLFTFGLGIKIVAETLLV